MVIYLHVFPEIVDFMKILQSIYSSFTSFLLLSLSPSLFSFLLLWSWKEKFVEGKAGVVRVDSSFSQHPKGITALSETTVKILLENNTPDDIVRNMGMLANCALAKIAQQSVAVRKCCTKDHQMWMHSTKSILAATEFYQLYFCSYQHRNDTNG